MNDQINAGAGTLSLKLPSNIGTVYRIHKNTWKMAFIFAFIALVIDGVDIMLLSFSLTSLKAEFGLSSFQAGMLGSISLAGMALGGLLVDGHVINLVVSEPLLGLWSSSRL